MRYIMMMFWGAIFGFIVGFIGSSLTHTTFVPIQAVGTAVVFAIVLGFVPALLNWSEKLSTK
ncbi:DUF2929 family protein [Agrilactobacillus fermenti]|uniref:DUF2929 family protein n=1 Tax=Agrilactobacillus fermenti TaxID=2586909 RepID=UPI001E3192F9|nr:DUF2929 family protein [Agrilactobacillus fermenti]